jgi:hypothetical protein
MLHQPPLKERNYPRPWPSKVLKRLEQTRPAHQILNVVEFQDYLILTASGTHLQTSASQHSVNCESNLKVKESQSRTPKRQAEEPD